MSFFTEVVRWVCACGCRYAGGAPCCPECRGTDYEEEAGVPKITVHDGPSYGPDPSAVAGPEVPEAAVEPPDPTQDPGLDQGSTPPPSSPASSDLSDGPEAAAAPVEPEADAPAAEVTPEPVPAPKKAAPSLSRAKDADG